MGIGPGQEFRERAKVSDKAKGRVGGVSSEVSVGVWVPGSGVSSLSGPADITSPLVWLWLPSSTPGGIS